MIIQQIKLVKMMMINKLNLQIVYNKNKRNKYMKIQMMMINKLNHQTVYNKNKRNKINK